METKTVSDVIEDFKKRYILSKKKEKLLISIFDESNSQCIIEEMDEEHNCLSSFLKNRDVEWIHDADIDGKVYLNIYINENESKDENLKNLISDANTIVKDLDFQIDNCQSYGHSDVYFDVNDAVKLRTLVDMLLSEYKKIKNFERNYDKGDCDNLVSWFCKLKPNGLGGAYHDMQEGILKELINFYFNEEQISDKAEKNQEKIKEQNGKNKYLITFAFRDDNNEKQVDNMYVDFKEEITENDIEIIKRDYKKYCKDFAIINIQSLSVK